MPKKLAMLAIVTILQAQATFAQVPPIPVEPATDESKTPIYVVIYPGQRRLMGPAPFENPGNNTFATLGSFGGLAGTLSGAALDSLATLTAQRPSLLRIVESTQTLGDDFDFEATIRQSLTDATAGTGYAVSEFERYRFEGIRGRTATRLMEYHGIDDVMFMHGTYIMTTNFDHLLLEVQIRYYRNDPEAGRTKEVANRMLTYVSPSRGNLFRPWDDGEKEALISMAEETYNYKVEQFPDNERAYRQDRDGVLDAVKGREVILPEMAVNEGWSNQPFEEEVERAAAHVSRMIREDLLIPHDEKGAKEDRVEFYTLTEEDYLKKRKGWELWRTDGNVIFRDTSGQMYSLPPGIYDFE